MSLTTRLAAVLVLTFFFFGQFCAAIPLVADTTRRSTQAVYVNHPARLQNVAVAQLGVLYAFQFAPDTFTLIDANSGATLKVPPIVALDPDSNVPHWLSFNPEKLTISGVPDAIPSSPYRIRLIATAPESGDINDTSFDLYVSNIATPNVISSLDHQYNQNLLALTNVSRFVTQPGVWIRPGDTFSIRPEPICDIPGSNSIPYYTAFQSSNSNFDALPGWLHFDNTTLTLTGIAPDQHVSTSVIFRCSSIFGAGGPQQGLLIDVTEHKLELQGQLVPFQLTPGQPSNYTLGYLAEMIWIDGNPANQTGVFYSNGSRSPLNVNGSPGQIGVSLALEKYPWLRFDSVDTVLYGTPPPDQELLHGLPAIPMNISARGQVLETSIQLALRSSSPWSLDREVGITIPAFRNFSHSFRLDLVDSVRFDPRWEMFVEVRDPLNDTEWLVFDEATSTLNGTVPKDASPRCIDVRAISNAWGFNTTAPYYINIENPDWIPSPSKPSAWSSTSVTVAIVLTLVIVLLLILVFMLIGLWRGCLVSPVVLYRRRHRSSQTLVDNHMEIGAGCCKPTNSSEVEVRVEPKTGTTAPIEISRPAHETVPRQIEHNPNGVTFLAPSTLPSPTSGTSPSTLVARSTASTPSPQVLSSPQTLASKRSSFRGKLKLFKKRVVFGKTTKSAVITPAVPSSHVESEEQPSYMPLWKGHVYQTPELLKAEEDAWKARRFERKARLKREYLARKEAGVQGHTVNDRFSVPKGGEDEKPRPGAPRRFGIFEQLAKLEDLDRRGPANMRGDVPRSCLVEVGENRYFNDTMPNRPEVGSSEFSSLASWETLSESSLPDMVLCYGQLGRRKVQVGDAPKALRSPVNPWSGNAPSGPVYREEGSLPEPDDDATTDENLLDRLARSLSDPSLDEQEDEAGLVCSPQESESNGVLGYDAAATSPVRWKGKGVTRSAHGFSQHSPTFKKLARQRFFKSSTENVTMGSPLSKTTITRNLAYTSPSSRSIATRTSSEVSPSSSMASLVFHVDQNGVHLYVIPAGTKFCFTARVNKVSGEGGDDRPTFGRAKTAAHVVQSEDPEDPSTPLWLNFNAPGLEFWGVAPNTDERLQHAMKIVHRASGEVVGRILIVVARLDDAANAQTALGHPSPIVKAPSVPASSSSCKLAAAINLVCDLQMPVATSSRSIASCDNVTNASPSGSTTNIVFHFARDGVDFFVIPANTKFCFEIPGLDVSATKPSLYAIHTDETSEVIDIPPWLRFASQSMELWGEAPDVDERLRVGMKVVQRETGGTAARLLIVVARIDDVESLQAELNYGRIKERDGLSVVEEVSSVASGENCVEDEEDENDKDLDPKEPKTPKSSRTYISVSSSHGARSHRGATRSQPGSRYNSPTSRRSPGTGGRGGRMRTPMSARLGVGEDYDSMMFEGHSQYSGSFFGPELASLAAGAVSGGALDAMSRAASQAGSIDLVPSEHTVTIVPTVMAGVEYYVIRGGADFCFTIQMPRGRTYGIEFEVDKSAIEGWKVPEWISVDVNEETGTLEFSGSTHGLEEAEEHSLVVLEGENRDVVKRVRVVITPAAKV